MKISRHSILIACAASMMFLGAGGSFAGEITGNGKYVPGGDTGRSACSFSGRQDNYEEDEGLFRSMIVQNWGQISKAMRDFLATIGLHPGDSCNPTKAGGEPA